MLCLGGLAQGLNAGIGQWSRIGPFADGGIVTALAIDPQTPNNIYAGTTAGVFRSTDGGAEWRSASDGLNGTVSGLVVDPRSSGTLYAASYSDGVFKTTDGGAHWLAVNAGLASSNSASIGIFSIAIDPISPSTLYVGMNGYPESMSKSIDGGTTWTRMFLGRDLAVFGIAVDPFSNSTVYAATSGGVYRTKDGGLTWAAQNAGLDLQDDGNGGSTVTLIEIDPLSPGHVFAGTLKGLFRSTEGGESWGLLSGGLPQGFRPVALAFSGSTGYLSVDSRGVFRTTDGGASWLAAGGGLRSPYIADLAIDPRGDSTVYAAMHLLTLGGVAKTTDRGASWTALPGRFRPVRVLDLVLDPNVPSRLYAATEVGVLRSDDGGATWSRSGFGFPVAEAWRLAIDPRSSVLYATADAPAAIFKTSDGGSTWFRAGSGLPPGHSIFSLTVVPTAPTSVLYAGVGYAGVFKSTDAGESWTSLGPAETTVTSVTANAQSPSVLYAGTGEGKILRSSDGGASWAILYNQPYRGICCLEIDPVRPATLYAGWGYSGPAPGGFVPPGGVLKSIDSGATWSELTGGPSFAVSAIAVDPRFPSRIFAGTIRGVVRSDDGGISWTSLTNGLPQFSFIQAIRIDPQPTNTLYAAVLQPPDTGGVFQLNLGPDRGAPVPPCRTDDCQGPVGRPPTRVVSPRSAPNP